MQRELRDFMDLVAAFKQAACRLVPQVMETQILNSQQVTGARECGADALGVIGKNTLARLRLRGGERPSLGRVLEPPVISVLASRMLRVPDQAGSIGLVVVAPFESADFRLPPRRGDGEFHDGQHGNLGPPISALEMLPQELEFIGGWPSRAFLGLADQAQLATGAPRLLHDLGIHGKLLDALGGSQNYADPDQVVDHGRRTGSLRTTRLHVPNEIGSREGVRNGLAERMSLQEFQVSLFAPLPTRDRLERLNVPADQFRKRRCAEPKTSQLRRIFERDFAVLGPAQRCGAVGKCPALPVQDGAFAAKPNYRRVTRGTVGLLAYFHRWHVENPGRHER